MKETSGLCAMKKTKTCCGCGKKFLPSTMYQKYGPDNIIIYTCKDCIKKKAR